MANEFKVRKGLVVNGSGSVILDVQGSQGQLFSVTDQLSGSLFAVKDISGMPVIEAFSDDTVRMGQYGQRALFVSQSSVGIGTENPTFKLDVSGSSKFLGNMIISGSGNSGATKALDIYNSSLSNLFYVQNNGNATILGAITAPSLQSTGQFGSLSLVGGANAGTGISITATGASSLTTSLNFVAITRTFDPTSGAGVYNNLVINPTINQTGGANGISRGLYVQPTITAAADWRSIEWSNNASTSPSASWGLYGSGSAPNYIAGNLLLGTTGSTGERLQVSGSTKLLGTAILSGSMTISGSSVAMSLRGSGSGVFTIDGTSGRLFSVDDSLSGSLFSVNTAAGLPVIEAFSDNTVRIGQYGQRALFVSQSRVGIGTETPSSASLTVNGNVFALSLTGSLLGTSSWSQNSLTGSLALTASSADNFTVRGTLTAQTIVAQVITSSTQYITGSTQFGSLLSNTHQFTGSVSITGSLSLPYYSQTGSVLFTGVDGLVTQSNGDLFWDNTNKRLGIGTNAPTQLFEAYGAIGRIAVRSTNNNQNSGFLLYAKGATGVQGSGGLYYVGHDTDVQRFFSISGDNTNYQLNITYGGNVLIGTTTNSGERLQVSGSTRLAGNTVITGSLTVITGSAIELQVTNIGVTIGNAITDSHTVTGSLSISGSARITNGLTVTGSVVATQNVTASAALISGSGTQRLIVVGSGSAQPLFTVQGSQGELFSIVDSLSGSLFSVNDISGLPIMEVFSDSTTLIGNYNAPMLLTTFRSGSANSGSNAIYAFNTSSYDAVFLDYTIRSGSNARAGNFMAIWSGSQVNFTDNSTTEFGNTSGFVFGAYITGSNMVVTGSATSAGWVVKTIIKAI